MTNLFLSKKYWPILLTACVLWVSCSKEEGVVDPVKEVQVTDANEVTKAIKIVGANVQTGNLTAPSGDNLAINLFDPKSAGVNYQASVVRGGSFALNILPQSGTVAGVYLKIKGSDSYLDIPLSGSSNGRLAASGSEMLQGETASAKTTEAVGSRKSGVTVSYLEVAVPENIQPGTFCAEYQAYNADRQVSNIIEVCVTVEAFGGSNATFLSQHPWDVVLEYNRENGFHTFIDSTGLTYYMETTYSVSCGNQTSQMMAVNTASRSTNRYMTISASGGFVYQRDYYEKRVDWPASSCDGGIVYNEHESHEQRAGAWYYNDTDKKLILVLPHIDTGELMALTYNLERKQNELLIEILYPSGNSSGILMKPRQ